MGEADGVTVVVGKAEQIRINRRLRAARYYAKHTEACAQRARVYQAATRERCNQRQRAWRAKNPDKVSLYATKYRARKQQTDRVWSATHPAHRNASNRRYYAKHTDHVLTWQHRREARKRNAALHDLTAAQWRGMKEHYGHRCVYCGRKMQRLTMDHITPIIQGGNHTASNVVPACGSCNSRKKDGAVLCPIQPLLLTIAPARRVA